MGWKNARAAEFARAIQAGSVSLSNQKEIINDLNVFPVPDGDTGTNMYMTMLAACQEMKKNSTATLGELARAAALGALMGARGNSGVIFSQLLLGFSRYLSSKDFVTPLDLAKGFQAGVDAAYKAVTKPVEGTILTVARAFASEFQQAVDRGNSIPEAYAIALREADLTLAKTPQMLPVLAQAGVVDAGGKGLLVILEGTYSGLLGKNFEVPDEFTPRPPAITDQTTIQATAEEEIPFEYCTELLIMVSGGEENLRAQLEPLGDSLLVVESGDVTKIHVHTNYPGQVLNIAAAYGSMHKIKIDNMREQRLERRKRAPEAAAQKYGVLAVADGAGLTRILLSLGANQVVPGGQTMNPSAKDLVAGIDRINAEHLFILPNNKNVVLTAEQVVSLTAKKVSVVPTNSFPQGMAALMALNQDLSLTENLRRMEAAALSTCSGEVTYAKRESRLGELDIKAADILGLVEGEIRTRGNLVPEVVAAVLRLMRAEDKEIATLFFGADIKKSDAEKLAGWLQPQFPDLQIEVQDGGQPFYFYLLTVE